ncbi:ABC transporter ATP-binding protein [Williamsia sp. R60]
MTDPIAAAGSRTLSARALTKTSTAPAISFDRVTVTYGRGKKATDALVDFSLRVAKGETVALLGPSGSGKSTALKALAGFVRPSSGRVRLNDRDVTDLPPARRGIGVVVQSYALFPHMRVGDNVAFGLRARRVRGGELKDRVAEALAMVSMSEYVNRLPKELSGGQQQRVAIARALAIRPDVLLLDEPLAALDAQLRQSMLGELQRLRDALPDTAMLYVTHDQSEALALADRIVVMRDARLIDVDTAENLWTRPPTTFTAAFLGGANLIPCKVGRVSGSAALVTVGDLTLSAHAPASTAWPPGSDAYLCVRPHTLTVGSPTARGALRARVATQVWRGASTRLSLSINGLPDVLVEADVPGHSQHPTGAEVGVVLPAQAGTLVPADAAR